MIAYLKGNIIEKTLTYLIIEQSGIGYKVFVTPDLIEKNIGDPIAIYIYMKVSDEGQTLFGMPDFATLQFFELLITVTSVGPKMAITIISSAKLDVLQNSIAAGDISIFTRMSGVGKKTAERIILELKNKVVPTSLSMTGSGNPDIYDALIALGYNPREVREVLPQLDSSASMQNQIKHALKIISKT